MREAAISQAVSFPPAADGGERGTHLRGWALVAARAAWVVIVAWILASFARSLPGQLQTFRHPGANSTELAPDAVAALLHLGITLGVYAWTAVVFGSLIMLAATVLAVVLFRRRSDDWMVLLVSLFFPAYCIQSIGPTESFNTPPSGSPFEFGNVVLLATVTFAIIYAVFMLFPGGWFVPAWSWALLVLCVPWFAAITAAPTVQILFLGYPVFLGAAIACQIYRRVRVSTPVQRQQTRWAVFGLVTALLANQVFWITSGMTPLGRTIYPPLAYLAVYGSVLLVPVTFFFAIQRHRLYDIDLIINRTLVYGTLTAVVAGLYSALVSLFVAVFRDVSRQSSILAIVLVTLFVTAAFTPVKARLQRLVDRLVPPEPDPAKVLRDFRQQVEMLRQVVNVEQLNLEGLLVRLLNEVVVAYGAQGGGVYLGEGENRHLFQSMGAWDGVAQLSAPIESHGREVGVVALDRRRSRVPYSRHDERVLREVVDVVSPLLTVESLELMRKAPLTPGSRQ